MTSPAPVVIAGLGPVGATLALVLARTDVPVLVLERERAVHPVSRAVALDDVALRVLQSAGAGCKPRVPLIGDPVLRFSDAVGKPLIDVPTGHSRLGHPSVAFFHSPDLDGHLRGDLASLPNADVRTGHELTGFDQAANGMTVTVRDRANGVTYDLAASFLVGCDGARSAVRHLAGIRMRGYTSARRWLVVDTLAGREPPAAPFEFICDPNRPTVSAPLPGARHRYEFMLLRGEEPREVEQPENVRALLAKRLPAVDLEALEVQRANVYSFHAQVARRWRRGRVFLAGDAAHLSPPFAGIGLSSGLRDAGNLAWKLSAVMHGLASSALLDTYELERRRDATQLIARAVLLGAVVQTTRRPVAASRDAALRAAARPSALQRWAAEGRWKPSLAYKRGFIADRGTGTGMRGGQIPQPHVRRRTGGEEQFDDVLGPGFALVGWCVDPRANLDVQSLAILDAFDFRAIRVYDGPLAGSPARDVTDVIDPAGVLAAWFGKARAPIALVRPDRHVYATFHPDGACDALSRFAKALEQWSPAGPSRLSTGGSPGTGR